MLQRAFACLLLAAAAGLAASPNFRLGIDYSEWGPYYFVGSHVQIAADSAGALYVLSECTVTDAANGPSCLTKYGADGKTVVWQDSLGVLATSMAVDPAGEVYLGLPTSVEKLGADGMTVLWSVPVTFLDSLAVDSTGRAFLLFESGVTRVNAAGTIDATFNLPSIGGMREAVAVDPTGSYILVAIRAYPTDTLASLGPAGQWVTWTPPLGTLFPGIAVAPGGDAVVYGTDLSGNRSLQRFDKTGAVVFTKGIPSQTEPASSNEEAPGNLALDAAGNAYITSYTGSFGTPVKNSLATCGSAWLGVYAPDGSPLQITYLPGATNTEFAFGLIAIGGSSVFVLDVADTTFTPTQTGPFPQYPFGPQVSPASYALFSLVPNPDAQTMPLACVVNAATFVANAAVAPGELVALYGNGLGPAQGVAPEATLQSPFPLQAAGTQVTFDGKPAPLMWVQDSQVNAAVPWSVAGPTTLICVTYNNAQTNCLTRQVAPSQPGVFTVDGVHAAALNQDGTMNSASNPAPRNSIVAIWATGLGPVSPAQPDGSLVGTPLPVNVDQVLLGTLFCIGGTGCPVTSFSPLPTTYAGPAPMQIAGMTQINFNLGSSPPNSFVVASAAYTVGLSNTFQIYLAGQ